MTQTNKMRSETTNRPNIQRVEFSLRQLLILVAKGFVGSIGTAVGAATISHLFGLSVLHIAIVFAVVATSGFFLLAFWIYRKFIPLQKWSELTDVTDLTDFERANEDSPYMPTGIFEHEIITKLWVMGNGCGKWTRKVAPNTARTKLKEIRAKADGQIRFLASCPVYLNQHAEEDLNLSQQVKEAMKIKAKENADSLIRLRGLAEQTGGLGGNFEIKVYKHTATLRLIILNDRDCILGHYKETGLGDSLESPLLIFRRIIDNEWGFGHAFHRLFDHEWRRAKEPTSEEWVIMRELSK